MSEQLGRYALERKLATGGMAEVFLARQSGPEGFEKICVVKRMLPGLTGDPGFVRMFLDEARLAAQLNHPNIAQIFDFGEVSGTYYLAMEYVQGTNLRAIVKANQKRGAFMQAPVAARIVSQAALALDYAHAATAPDGSPLGLVHRDVSPQNILLGSAGTVKLIDFGVAKAAGATHHTRTGLIKGKYAYMSPEQLRAQPLDRRSDVYALGLVLYELLASARAIQGAGDVEIMENAIKMAFEPLQRRRPDLPEELGAVVRRSLQKDRDARYQSAQDMSAALELFITRQGVVITGADLVKLLADIPEAQHQVRAEEVPSSPTPSPSSSRRPAIAPAPASTEWPEVPEPTEVETRRPSGGGAPRLVGQQPTRVGPAPQANPTTTEDIPPPAVERSGASAITTGLRRALLEGQRRLAVVIGVAVAFGVTAGFWLGGRSASGDDPALPDAPPVAATPPALPPPSPPPKPAPPETGTLAFGAAPAMDIWVDGVLRGRTPLILKLPPGRHDVVFREDRLGLSRTEQVDLAPGETRRREWRPAKGTVSIRAVPYAEVFVREKRLGLTPLDPVTLFEGRHQFRFVNKETSRSEIRDVEVLGGRDTLVKVDLRAQ
ncbi:MAG TPA: protein kinase [Myxococcales bacterium]|nr:protein kinase [Myxococcales bacterium]